VWKKSQDEYLLLLGKGVDRYVVVFVPLFVCMCVELVEEGKVIRS